MNYNHNNHLHKYSYKELVENTHDFYTESGLIDNLFLDLCRTKTDTSIRGSPINISVIIPNEGGTNQVQINKYFDYAIRNTPGIIIGEPNYPVIIDKEDIRPNIINELESLNPFVRQNIIKQSFLKIFEITSPQICYLSIAPRLKVEIRGLKMSMASRYDKKTSDEEIITSTNFLIDRYTFATMKDTDEIYYYDSNRGIYVKGGEVFIKSELAVMHTYLPTNQVNEIINTIKLKTYTDRKEFDSKIEWLACKDCMMNLKTGETRHHSPDFMVTIQIPVSYKKFLDLPNNQFSCPKIMKFLHEIVSDKRDIETILDFMAYCLWPEMKYHKLLLLNGEGRNGKGTLCKLITLLLGRENVSSESLDQLLNGRFSPSQLYGKLVNIDADTSKEISKKIGILKKLTGNDVISAEEKFKAPFNFVNYAKLIQVTNELPEIKEDTIAIFSRLVIIDFSKTFIKNANPDLIDELTVL